MNIKPIRNDEDYQTTLAEIDQLFDAESNSPDGEKLEILITLVEAYENENYPIGLPDPIEAIKYHLESRGLTRRDLEPYIGSRARVSEVMNRKRQLTLNMIRRLSAGLGIPAEALIQPYEINNENFEVVEVIDSMGLIKTTNLKKDDANQKVRYQIADATNQMPIAAGFYFNLSGVTQVIHVAESTNYFFKIANPASSHDFNALKAKSDPPIQIPNWPKWQISAREVRYAILAENEEKG
jgi:HTH-type transcriptional regulator / antitoxin HigA